MNWASIEVTNAAGETIAGHVMPCGDDGFRLNWHTTSELCGCNPRKDVNAQGIPIYIHFESETSQEGQNDGDSS